MSRVDRPEVPIPAALTPITTSGLQTRDLVLRVQSGDTDAFGIIYTRYVDHVFRFVFRRVRDRQLAEDLTSETFIRALHRIHRFVWQGRDLSAWLSVIARNLVIDHFRRVARRREVPIADIGELKRPGDYIDDDDPERLVLRRMTDVQLWRSIQELKAEQRVCLIMRFIQGFSVTETAHAIGKTNNATRALQCRAVQNLRGEVTTSSRAA
jgi:RNA polymerase sigma-70 factor (ECF subfamily)